MVTLEPQKRISSLFIKQSPAMALTVDPKPASKSDALDSERDGNVLVGVKVAIVEANNVDEDNAIDCGKAGACNEAEPEDVDTDAVCARPQGGCDFITRAGAIVDEFTFVESDVAEAAGIVDGFAHGDCEDVACPDVVTKRSCEVGAGIEVGVAGAWEDGDCEEGVSIVEDSNVDEDDANGRKDNEAEPGDVNADAVCATSQSGCEHCDCADVACPDVVAQCVAHA